MRFRVWANVLCRQVRHTLVLGAYEERERAGGGLTHRRLARAGGLLGALAPPHLAGFTGLFVGGPPPEGALLGTSLAATATITTGETAARLAALCGSTM